MPPGTNELSIPSQDKIKGGIIQLVVLKIHQAIPFLHLKPPMRFFSHHAQQNNRISTCEQ